MLVQPRPASLISVAFLSAGDKQGVTGIGVINAAPQDSQRLTPSIRSMSCLIKTANINQLKTELFILIEAITFLLKAGFRLTDASLKLVTLI